MSRQDVKLHKQAAAHIAAALGYEADDTVKVRGQLQTRIVAPRNSDNYGLDVLLNGYTAQILVRGSHKDGVRRPMDPAWEDKPSGTDQIKAKLEKYGAVFEEDKETFADYLRRVGEDYADSGNGATAEDYIEAAAKIDKAAEFLKLLLTDHAGWAAIDVTTASDVEQLLRNLETK